MNFLKRFSRHLCIGLLAVSPDIAHAYGGADVQTMALSIFTVFWPLWIIVGILVLVIAGFTLMTTQDEGRLQKAKTTLISVITGGILTTIIVVMGPLNFVGIVYNGTPGFSMINTGNVIGLEAIGVSQWLTAICVMMGVLFIIIGVLRAVASLGDEAAYTAARSQLLHVIVGVILIAGAFLVQLAFFGSASGPGQVVTGALNIEPNPLLGLISQKLIIILNIITLIAVGILIYAGLRMIVSFGREEDYNNAKALALRVIVGLLVLVLSYSLVFIVAAIFT